MKTMVAATNFLEAYVNTVKRTAGMACVMATDLLLVLHAHLPVMVIYE